MSPRAAARLEAMGFDDIYDYVAGKSDWLAAGLESDGTLAGTRTVAAAADAAVPTCRLDDELDAVRRSVRAARWAVCVVLDERRVVLGLLGREAIAGDDAASVEEVMTEGPSTVRPNVSAEDIEMRMAERGLHHVVVTTSDGRLVGVVRREG